MLAALKSFAFGFISVLVGNFECLRWIWLRLSGMGIKFPVVSDIWLERRPVEIVGYFIGQALFLSWPALVGQITAESLRAPLSKVAVLEAIMFCLFSLATLACPVGARKRYRLSIIRAPTDTGYERCFLGQMPPSMLFSARGAGAVACLLETILTLAVLVVGFAFAQLAVFNAAPSA